MLHFVQSQSWRFDIQQVDNFCAKLPLSAHYWSTFHSLWIFIIIKSRGVKDIFCMRNTISSASFCRYLLWLFLKVCSYISFAPVQLSPALTSSTLWRAAVVFSPRWLALLFKLTLKLLTQKLYPLEIAAKCSRCVP